MSKPNALKEFLNGYTVSCIIGFGFFFVVAVAALLLGENKLAAVVLLGGMCPTMFSLFNCIVVNLLTAKFGVFYALCYNVMGFITKSIFMLSMTYLGVSLLKLPVNYYIFTLCFVWFLFHLVEGFYSQSLIEEKIRSGENTASDFGPIIPEALFPRTF